MSEAVPRRPIGILPPAVAQSVAAGEIVQRPTDVLRELIENAIDAQATTIAIEWQSGGLQQIAVHDDGHGIPPHELRLAFERFGTSKVQVQADLSRITTLGFRGEALAAIAAVATVDLSSAVDDIAAGAHMVVRSGSLLEEGRVARTRGTTVRVRALFMDEPTRLTFLPAARAENAMALTCVRRYALARPDVRFTMTSEGRQAFRSPGLGSRAALSAAFGAAGRRFSPLAPLDYEGVAVTGLIADPGLTRGDRDGMVLVVNGRWVQPRRWLAALEAAYGPLLPRGRHPLLVLYLTIDPAQVDVNLHPSKLEVRVAGEDRLLDALAQAIRQSLGTTPQPSAELFTSVVNGARQREFRGGRRIAEDRAVYDAAPRYEAMRVIGHLHHRLILTEDEAGLYLVDQHRADERVIFDRLLRGAFVSQELLEPLSVELRPDQQLDLELALPELTCLGFRCERFGRRVFLVRTTPSGLDPGAAGAVIEFALSGMLSGNQWQDRLRASVACRAALRRGVPLADDQSAALLRALSDCEVQSICPHGSPITVRIDARDLSRLFDWS